MVKERLAIEKVRLQFFEKIRTPKNNLIPMTLKKPFSIFVLCLFVTVFAGCNSGSEERVEAQSVQNNSPTQETAAGDAIYETVENGFRLTESSLKSLIPETLLGIEKTGEISYEESRRGYSTVYQMYYDSEDYSANYLDIYDHGDDQDHINDMQEGMQYTNFEFSQTRQNEQGWYITESYEARGDDVTSRTLTVRNPRFMIELRTVPGDAPEIPSFEAMMRALEEANLLDLMELEIPQGEAETRQVADDRNNLSCDNILPVEQVRSFCGIDGVEVNVTSFEQQKNCNRQYAHPDNFGGLTFIVTQYAENATAVSAVETKLNDGDLASEEIGNLGNAASMVTVDDDLFLSVAHNNYLVELRSSYGMGPAETASVCQDKGKLQTLASDVIGRLP